MSELFNYKQEEDHVVIQPKYKWSVVDLTILLQELYPLGFTIEKLFFDFSLYAKLPVHAEPNEDKQVDTTSIEYMVTKGVVMEILYSGDLPNAQTFSYLILNTPQISDGVVVKRV